VPAARLAAIAAAGEAGVPFTTGLLIGLGESRADRLRDLRSIRDLHRRYGHIQVRFMHPSVCLSVSLFGAKHWQIRAIGAPSSSKRHITFT
jgi:hypothetical protein